MCRRRGGAEGRSPAGGPQGARWRPQRQDRGRERGFRRGRLSAEGAHRDRHGPRLHVLLPREPRGPDRRRRRTGPLLAARRPETASRRRPLHRRRLPRALHGAARGQRRDARGGPPRDRSRGAGLGRVRRVDVPLARDLVGRPPRGDGRRAPLRRRDGRPPGRARLRPPRGDGARRVAARGAAAARAPSSTTRGSSASSPVWITRTGCCGAPAWRAAATGSSPAPASPATPISTRTAPLTGRGISSSSSGKDGSRPEAVPGQGFACASGCGGSERTSFSRRSWNAGSRSGGIPRTISRIFRSGPMTMLVGSWRTR